MKHRPYRAATDPAVQAALVRRHLVILRSHAESAQGYFERSQELGQPCIIATMPRVTAEIELLAVTLRPRGP